MLILLVKILLIFMIVNLLMIISNIVSKKTFKDREKNSPFECGFDPENSGRLPFSLQFFLIAIMFLIFEVEITLLPSISIIKISNLMFFNYMYMFFIFILLKGLNHDWNQGALNWEL